MTMTPSDIEWLMTRDSKEPGIWLVTLTGGDFTTDERYAIYKTDITSNGNIFKKSWFQVEDAGDTDEMPMVRAVVPNVNRVIGLALEQGGLGFTAHLEQVRDSDHDHVVQAFRNLKIRKATIDHLAVTMSLSAANYDNEPYAAVRVSPKDFPGLFLQ